MFAGYWVTLEPGWAQNVLWCFLVGRGGEPSDSVLHLATQALWQNPCMDARSRRDRELTLCRGRPGESSENIKAFT